MCVICFMLLANLALVHFRVRMFSLIQRLRYCGTIPGLFPIPGRARFTPVWWRNHFSTNILLSGEVIIKSLLGKVLLFIPTIHGGNQAVWRRAMIPVVFGGNTMATVGYLLILMRAAMHLTVSWEVNTRVNVGIFVLIPWLVLSH